MSNLARLTRLLAGALSLLAADGSTAAEFCASNAVQLAAALNAAESNGEDDTIRIAAGNYNAGGFLAFSYDGMDPGGDDHDLTLLGGYSEFFGNPCGQRLIDDPLLTVLDAGGVRRVLRVSLRQNSDLTIRFLTFINGNADSGGSRGGGLEIDAESGSTGRITIERNAFINNQALFGGGLSATSFSGGFGQLRLINNLFLGNHASGNIGAAELGNGMDTSSLGGIWVANNTVIGNTVDTTTVPTGGLYVYGPVGKYVYNNNLWDNTSADLRAAGAGSYVVQNNNIGVRIGVVPTANDNNLSVAPEYEAGLFNYTPRRTSPLVDAGRAPPPPVIAQWYLTEHDLRYADRVVGDHVDIGAYENERIFANGFQPPSPLSPDTAAIAR